MYHHKRTITLKCCAMLCLECTLGVELESKIPNESDKSEGKLWFFFGDLQDVFFFFSAPSFLHNSGLVGLT